MPNNTNNKSIEVLKAGGIGVMPTDTIYGLVGSALSEKTVERIYKVRRRKPEKPFIVLIGSMGDLKLFKIKVDNFSKKALTRIWPGKVSAILPCRSEKFSYLHRGTKTLAFRLPANVRLRNLLQKTGPLVAPSANPEGLRPAKNIKEAKKYFGKKIDFYMSGKKPDELPSTLIQIKNKNIVILRQGKIKIKK
jgi:L-threonylcarbamoyladenylate synthase